MNPETVNRRSLPRRVIPAVLLVLLLGGIIAVAVVFVRFQAVQRVRQITLPDGSKVEMLGVAVGNTKFTTEKPWHRTARKLLPGKLKNWIPAAVTSNCGSESNSMTVYVRVTSPTGGPPGGTTPWARYQAEDDAGFLYISGAGYCSSGGPPGTTSKVYGLTLRSHPRRQKDFLFHLMGTADARMATFRVPNPIAGPFPEWKPEPMPQKQTNGPVTLTLQGLTQRGTTARPLRSVSATWAVESSDPAWTNARARYITFADATGNEGQFLSPRETALKVRTKVFRERPEDFAAKEKMVLTNLPVLAPGAFVSLDQSTNCDGITFNVSVLAGAGRLSISNGVRTMSPVIGNSHSTSSSGTNSIESWGSSNPFLLVEARNTQQNDVIEFRIRDDQGREVKVPDSGWNGGMTGTRSYKAAFTPLGNAKILTLVILVNRPLEFEFMVNPADIKRPGP